MKKLEKKIKIGIPNWLTIFRIFLVPVFIIFIGYNKPLYALLVFILAGLTDALDGYLARKLNQITNLGKILDPIADKALLVSAFIFIYNSNFEIKFPYWFVVLVISRDIYLVAGSALIYFFKGYVKIKPSIFGKITTFLQILSVIVVLCANIFYFPYEYVQYLLYITALFTVLSAIFYTRDGLLQL